MSNPLPSSPPPHVQADAPKSTGQIASLEDKLRSLSIDRSRQADGRSAPPDALPQAPAGRGPRFVLWALGLGGLACAAAALYYLNPLDRSGPAPLTASLTAPAAPRVETVSAAAATSPTPVRPAPAAGVIGSGHVVARHELALGSRITGQVDRVLVEAGQHVRAGMPLVELDRTDAELALRVAQAEVALAEAAVTSARAEVAAAQAPLRRLAELVPRGAASPAALEDAQLDLARLDQEVQHMQRQYDIALLHAAQARRTLSLHTIVAPFDAVVADPRAVPGQVIVETGQSGRDETVLMTLLDTTLLYVDVDIAERNVAQIRPGLSAELRLDAWPERSFPARVISIEPRASREKGTVTARLEFAPGETGAVLVNMAAKVTFAPDTTLSALN